MSFSHAESKLIGRVQALVRGYGKGIYALQELVRSVLDEAAWAEADRIVPHCMALLPTGARAHVENSLEWLESIAYGQRLVLALDGKDLTEAERAWLGQRYRAIAGLVVEHYRRFGDRVDPPPELAVPLVDDFWEHLRGIRTDDDSTCEVTDCHLPPLWVSLYCARHDYEHSVGRPPPDY